ncbi:MAG: PAS domain S-box protein, partial [Coleofasciculus sp. S288]|nr:PAS domain S-box protein [Coleofasciculus sp. S288]
MLNTARSQLKPYGIALLAVISTLLLTRLLESLLTPTVFILFFPAVVVSALYGGMNSGLLASILSAFVCKFFFLPPVYSLAISDLGTGVRLGIFLLVTLLITTTSSALRTARHRVEISLLKLRASEERYRVLAENVPQLVWITRADGFVDYFNQRWFNYTGLKPEQTLGWDWQQVVHPEDLPSTLEQWTTGLTTGNPFEIHYRLKGADGIYRWHIGRALPLRNPNGEIVNWFGTCTDIHDQKQVAEEVRQSQERLGFLANASRLLATSLDYETTLTNVARLAMPYLADVCAVDLVEENEPPVGQTLRRVAVAHIDPSKEELLYEIAHRYPPVAIALSPVKKALESGQSVLLSDVAESALADDAQDAEHLKLIRDIGSFCSTIIVPLIARGRTIGTILLGTTDSGRHYNSSDLCLAEDFAQRIALAVDNARLYWETQEAERRKDESLALLDAFLSSTPVGFAFFDRQRRYIRINDYLAAINGIPAAEHLGRTVGEILPPELALLVDIRHQQVLETGEPVLNVEESGETLAARNPESYWLSSYYPVRSSAEELLGIGMAVTEITERKQAQERIQLYADVVKNAQVGIVVWQLEDWENPGSFRLITSNPAACQFTDVDFESLVGTTMAESFPTLTKTHLIREYVEVVRTGEPKDLGEVRYEDERITAGIFSLKAFPLPHRCLGLAFENITQRKYVEEALRDALQKLNFHVENTPLAVIERDRNFCITRWSQGAERIFGWKAEDVIGKGLNELEFVFVEDKEAVNALRLRLINGDETHNISNNRSYRKDGSVVYCEWYNSALLDESGNLVSVLSLVL